MIADHPAGADRPVLAADLTCGGSAITAPGRGIPECGLALRAGWMTETSPGATSLPARFGPERGVLRPAALLRLMSSTARRCRRGRRDPRPGTRTSWPATGTAPGDRAGDDRGRFRPATGYRDEGGFLFITDRLGHDHSGGRTSILPRSRRDPELAEVDTVAVIGIPDEKWGEVPGVHPSPPRCHH